MIPKQYLFIRDTVFYFGPLYDKIEGMKEKGVIR